LNLSVDTEEGRSICWGKKGSLRLAHLGGGGFFLLFRVAVSFYFAERVGSAFSICVFKKKGGKITAQKEHSGSCLIRAFLPLNEGGGGNFGPKLCKGQRRGQRKEGRTFRPAYELAGRKKKRGPPNRRVLRDPRKGKS